MIAIDAQKLAELLRNGSLKAVDHADHGVRVLKELVRNYECLVQDTTRVMSRLKAIYRGRAIDCHGHEIYRQDQRAQWLRKLKEPGAKQRADFLYEQLAALQPLRQKAKLAMVREARKQAAYPWLMSVPRLGAGECGAVAGNSGDAASLSQQTTVLDLRGLGSGDAQHGRSGSSQGRVAPQSPAGSYARLES